MKRSAILCLTTLLAAGAQAQTFNDTARVRTVNPQYENVSVPRNECSSQWVTEQQPVAASRNYGGLAIGGVAGALLGHQVGGGRGRDAATAVGAVVGALAGEHFANQNNWGGGYQQASQPQQRQVQNCRTVNDVQSRLTGYQVEYEYRGQVYSTVTRENPGRTLPVRVSVAPVEPTAPVGREFQGVREYQGGRDDGVGREYYGAYNR
ncbi:glycine zipper 2TM domain-containing protein [Polaromonas sp.]|uniref:glycine zipper 2TM domain-containing protein n=1 Tax=Polaromonas sp. TaxID=1869339 RepID=UPI00286CAF69|nr:glycine zipper 2TM domain-containing protein [Polaromonas sp.]